MITRRRNFSRSGLQKFFALDPKPGDVFEQCNFSQALPRTKIADTYTGLTFRDCNMRNIDPPADAVLERCPNSQWEYCKNKNPKFTELPDCPPNCKHVSDTHSLRIDSLDIDTTYEYEDVRLD